MQETAVEITFKGEASVALADEFDCLDLVVGRGVTRLRVPRDAAIVHGILAQIQANGLELIAVREVSAAKPSRPPPHMKEPQ